MGFSLFLVWFLSNLIMIASRDWLMLSFCICRNSFALPNEISKLRRYMEAISFFRTAVLLCLLIHAVVCLIWYSCRGIVRVRCIFFYRAMLAQSAVMRLHVVCPSVSPSVTFRYHDHIGWNSSKIISRPNSLRPTRSLTPNMGDLVQREPPQN